MPSLVGSEMCIRDRLKLPNEAEVIENYFSKMSMEAIKKSSIFKKKSDLVIISEYYKRLYPNKDYAQKLIAFLSEDTIKITRQNYFSSIESQKIKDQVNQIGCYLTAMKVKFELNKKCDDLVADIFIQSQNAVVKIVHPKDVNFDKTTYVGKIFLLKKIYEALKPQGVNKVILINLAEFIGLVDHMTRVNLLVSEGIENHNVEGKYDFSSIKLKQKQQVDELTKDLPDELDQDEPTPLQKVPDDIRQENLEIQDDLLEPAQQSQKDSLSHGLKPAFKSENQQQQQYQQQQLNKQGNQQNQSRNPRKQNRQQFDGQFSKNQTGNQQNQPNRQRQSNRFRSKSQQSQDKSKEQQQKNQNKQKPFLMKKDSIQSGKLQHRENGHLKLAEVGKVPQQIKESKENKLPKEMKESMQNKLPEQFKEEKDNKLVEQQQTKNQEEIKITEQVKAEEQSKPTEEMKNGEESKNQEQVKNTESNKPSEQPKVEEQPKSEEESKPSEQVKVDEQSKSEEQGKTVETNKHEEQNKATEQQKTTEQPQNSEQNKNSEESQTNESSEKQQEVKKESKQSENKEQNAGENEEKKQE
eukprot:TRINITY_DN8436_c0_g1_i1.p1 TRINITY_DN8436_c0_g1~~TRINITY_DN8436_c0_g1_i1.p1  ORF type:complete len:581 (+),score=157.95 TRINITY_DN8436_c0_g1_i1:105-1847(+)